MIPRFTPNAGFASWISAFLPVNSGEVETFEQRFAALMGLDHAVAFPYGRTALVMLLEAMGVRGREVLCPAYTCVVVAHAVMASGNTPVFVDSEPGGINMDLEQAARKVTARTAAILATSLFGLPVELDALDAFRSAHPGVRVIQDCALSYDAAWKGRPVQHEGDAAIFSFNAGKPVFAVFAGMAATRDADLAGRLRAVRAGRIRPPGVAKRAARRAYLAASLPAFLPPVYGLVHRLVRSGLLDRFVKYFDEGVVDMPPDYLVGLTPEEARAGVLNLSRHASSTASRRDVAAFYDRELRGIPGVGLPPLPPGATWSHYPVLIAPDLRALLLEQAAGRGVELGTLFDYSIPDMKAYRRDGSEDYPRARALAGSMVNLPVFSGMKGARQVVKVLKEILPG